MILFQGSNPGLPDQWRKDNRQNDHLFSFPGVHGDISLELQMPLPKDDFTGADAENYLYRTEFQPISDYEILFQYDPEMISKLGNTQAAQLIEDGVNNCITGDGNTDNAEDIMIANVVAATQMFNFQQARIVVNKKWNTDLFEQLLEGYEDQQVVEFAKYGWPIDRDGTVPLPAVSGRNHRGATEFPEAVNEHIKNEIRLQALAGPFEEMPLQNFVCSPINSRPKRNSDKRRIIMDLSWEPDGPSVNAGISKDYYLGQEVRLRYPTVRTMIKRIKFLADQGDELIMMYKRDWARAFSQLVLDPGCYHLIGFVWQGRYYFSKVVPMGLVSACLTCQRTTSSTSPSRSRLKEESSWRKNCKVGTENTKPHEDN